MKRTRIRPMSERRQGLVSERRALVERVLAQRPTCEAPSHLRAIVHGLPREDQDEVVGALRASGPYCRSSEVHEVLSRARGGSIVDESNVMALCHIHHAWVTAHPRLATMAGLMRSSRG
jgi:hypothetical protein